MQAVRHIARRHIHHTTQRRRSVQRRTGALQDVHAFDLVDREQVPIDPTAIALVHWDTVDGQQHARVQPLDVSGRATNVDLAVHELNAGHMIDCFIHRVHRAAIEIPFADLRDAGGGALAKMRQLLDDRGNGRQRERRESELEVDTRRIRGYRDDGIEARVPDRIHTDVDRPGGHLCEAIAAARVRAREERRSAETDLRVADGRALVVMNGAVQRHETLRPECCRRQRERGKQRYCAVHVTKSVAGRRLSRLATKLTSPAAAPVGTVTTPGWDVSAGLR